MMLVWISIHILFNRKIFQRIFIQWPQLRIKQMESVDLVLHTTQEKIFLVK